MIDFRSLVLAPGNRRDVIEATDHKSLEKQLRRSLTSAATHVRTYEDSKLKARQSAAAYRARKKGSDFKRTRFPNPSKFKFYNVSDHKKMLSRMESKNPLQTTTLRTCLKPYVPANIECCKQLDK